MLDNPLRKFECDGTILGLSKLITTDDKYVYKYSFNKDNWPGTEIAVEMLKEFDPELYVDTYRAHNYLCVVINKIDHIEAKDVRTTIPYKDSVRAYLALYKTFGNFVCKKDLNPSNILFRNSDLRPFLIDWDEVQYFKTYDKCHQYYRTELTDRWWQLRYKFTRKRCEETFDMEWEKLQ